MTSDPRPRLHRFLRRFGSLTDAAGADLDALATTRAYDRGDSFAAAGTQPAELGFDCDGVFRAFLRTEDGVEYNKTFFVEDTIIAPLTSLIEGQPNRIDLEALTPARLLVFDYTAFTALYDRHRDLERIARRLVEFEWARKERREIALVLDDALARYRAFQAEHPGLEARIPQYHIASYLGITPIHLSRIRGRAARGSD